MTAILYVLYSLCAYLFFFGTFLGFVGFVGDLPLHRSVDAGPAAPLAQAVLVDLGLLALFGVQHSVMARAAFKRWLTRAVPPVLERSTYVLASSLVLAIVMWQWRPIPAPVVWQFSGAAAVAMQALFWSGWAVMLASSFLIDHGELFGLKQVFCFVMKEGAPEQPFRTPAFYRYVRHPLYTGLLAAFWATPRMTVGHLLFAAGFTAYILVGIGFEERDLVAQFGSRYLQYRRRVGMLLPWRRGSA